MPPRRAVELAVLVAALGYFVDIYDLILFSVVRVKSLVAIGVPESELLDAGLRLLNLQMFGMLLGGIAWGVLGDRRGRLSVLFGSIVVYSVATLANASVQSIATYGWLRFIAGVGLAGELGAGITLVSEVMDRRTRGYGTTIVAAVGILGAVFAGIVAKAFDWRIAYVVGGGLGLALLLLRVSVRESPMFHAKKPESVRWGNFFALFSTPRRAVRYLALILVATPIWFVVGILVTFSREIGRAMGMTELPDPGVAIPWLYGGLVIGDLASGLLSQYWKSRRKVIVLFIGLTVAAGGFYFNFGSRPVSQFYLMCGLMGIASGYWAVFMTLVAEQFGTNLRATATTTAPNFVRGAVVPMTAAFRLARARLDVIGAGMVVGVGVALLAVASLLGLDETFGKDLDYVEH